MFQQLADQARTQARELETQMARRAERLASLRMQREHLTEAASAQERELAQLHEELHAHAEGLREREARAEDLARQAHDLERGQSTSARNWRGWRSSRSAPPSNRSVRARCSRRL